MSRPATRTAAGSPAESWRRRILIGDAVAQLKLLPDNSIDCIVTSPPYFRLRNYQREGQVGLERHVDDWAAALRHVLRQCQRVLKPTGSLWLNLGDTYARSIEDGASPKSLLLAPERVARLLLDDGWIIRNKVIWAKTNPMPSSVRDRLSCSYEVLYFAVRSRHYFFDLDAVRTPHLTTRLRGTGVRTASAARATTGTIESSNDKPPSSSWSVPEAWRAPLAGNNRGLDRLHASRQVGHPLGKNPGDVWRLPTAGFRGAHHAVFPEILVERPLLATCPERVCSTCGQPWARERARRVGHLAVRGELLPACRCDADWRPGVVLDPFLGSGTTAVVAERLQRDWIGVELNPDFAALAKQRIRDARVTRETDGPANRNSNEQQAA